MIEGYNWLTFQIWVWQITESWNFWISSSWQAKGCQQTWQGLPGIEQNIFLLKQSIYLTKILKYSLVVNPYMKYRCLSQFQVSGWSCISWSSRSPKIFKRLLWPQETSNFKLKLFLHVYITFYEFYEDQISKRSFSYQQLTLVGGTCQIQLGPLKFVLWDF